MSHRQFGTLKFIRNHNVYIDHVRTFNLTTFGSLAHRGWVKRNGNQILLTNEGEIAYEQYNRAAPSYRKNQNEELSERVRLMLGLRLNQQTETA